MVTGLAARGEDRYRTYSLGMKQRLGVAAALLGSPRTLVLDEPFNGMDPTGDALEMQNLVRRLSGLGTTVIVSSHALADIEMLCPAVTVMVRGRLVADDQVRNLVGSPTLRVRVEPPTSLEQAQVLLATKGRSKSDATSAAASSSSTACTRPVPPDRCSKPV